MLDRIKESNRYKNFKLELTIGLVFFGSLTIVSCFLALVFGIEEDLMFALKLSGMFVLIYGILFLPLIFYFLYRMIKLKKSADDYIIYTGEIQDIYTSYILRLNYRVADVYIKEINYKDSTKVYRGSLYDEVGKGTKVEVGYNKNNGDIIILKAF